MYLVYNDIYFLIHALFLFSPSLQVFHCVHFECPAQQDTEVKEGTPGSAHPNLDHGSQPQGLSTQRSTTLSMHT